MKILAVDCSAGPASVAICENGKILASSFSNVKVTHSETLMPMIESTLSSAKLTLGDIEGFAISHGPGSFTGIRIGIAAVKGLAAAKKVPCVGVSTLLSMAYNCLGDDCIVCAVMDARCNQVYNAIFEVEGDKITRLSEDRAILSEDLAEELKNLSQKSEKRVIIVGDGTDVFSPYAEDINGVFRSAENRRYQNAVSVGLAADESFENKKSLSPEELLPVYLRLPQAERELKNKKEVKL